MPLFQDIGKKFADAAKVVSQRTAEATETVRLNGRVSNLEDEIERLFNQVGKAYYSMRGASGECDAANKLSDEIDKLTEEMNQLKEELDRIRNLRRCPNCGEVQPSPAQFCSNCGTKMPMPEPQPEPEVHQAPEREGDAPEVEISWPKAEPADPPEDELPEDEE